MDGSGTMADEGRLAAFLISLPRSQARRARARAQLAGLPFAVRHLPGVDGRAEWAGLAPSVAMGAFRRNTGREVLPGEIGCYHAHLEAWRQLIASGAGTGLVLEDDVILHPDFAEAVATALAARGAWDFLKLNRIRARSVRIM